MSTSISASTDVRMEVLGASICAKAGSRDISSYRAPWSVLVLSEAFIHVIEF